MRHRVFSLAALAAVLAACDDTPAGPGGGDAAAAPPSARLALSTAGAAPYGYACFGSIAPSQAAANAEIRASYARWDSLLVTTAGAGGYRRVDSGPNFQGGTVSEAIGYGMLLSAYMGDRVTFDGLWGYAKSKFNRRGLMAWDVSATGTVRDSTAATDADVDMGLALLMAERRWGGYWSGFQALVDSMAKYELEAVTHVLKPGDTWGGSAVTNASYFAPGAFRTFHHFRGDSRWTSAAGRAYAIIDSVNARGSGRKLLPGWTDVHGDTAAGFGGYDYNYGSARIPWRLAQDAAWNCNAAAKTQLDRMNAHFASETAAGLDDGYTLEGTATGSWQTVVFVGPAAAGMVVSSDSADRDEYWTRAVNMREDNYYGAEIRLLSLLFASGNMPDPRDVRRRWLADFESGSTSPWWTYAATGSTVSLAVERPSAVGYGMKVSYGIASGGWGGAGLSFVQDWSGQRALEFWFRGTGSGNTIRLELSDNPGSTGATEIFQHLIVDDFTGWRFASIPLDSTGFQRRAWQPAGAPNDGLTLTQVGGLTFNPVGGTGSFGLDRIELAPR